MAVQYGINYNDPYTGQQGPLSQTPLYAAANSAGFLPGSNDQTQGNGGGIPFLGSRSIASYVPSPVANAGNLAASQNGDIWSQLSSILNSNSGQSALSSVGAGMSAIGQGQQNSQQQQIGADQFAANMANNQLNSANNIQLAQATAGAQLDPLGADQNYAQKQKIAQILLGGARNFSVTPGDPAVAAAMGKTSGGLQLPQGGIDPNTINSLFGDAATQAAIAQRAKAIGQVNPNAPVPDLGSMYGNSADGSENAFVSDIKNNNAQALNAQNTRQSTQQNIINNAINNMQTVAKQHPGLWQQLLGMGVGAAPGIIGAIAKL